MPGRKVPSYCRHKASGQAYVTIDRREHYLGKYGSAESREKYARILAEQFPRGNGSRLVTSHVEADLTIDELILRYWTERVQIFHVKDGKPSERQYHIRLAMRPLRSLFGSTLSRQFGPKMLKLVREQMIVEGQQNGKGLNRRYVNDHIGIIKRMFRWAVSEELVHVDVHKALETLESVHKGRDPRVTEGEKIRPVSTEHIRAVMEAASPQIRDMVGLQDLTGMRPDEVTSMRPCDIDETGEKCEIETGGIWVYAPQSHKTQWRGIDRLIPLGPRAQAILRPWLDRPNESLLFSPREVVNAKLGRQSGSGGGNGIANWKSRKPRERYDDETYCQAVQRICDRIRIPRWTPNQLRHTAATRLRAKYGIEAARVILGHSSAVTTELYAERDLRSALSIMNEVG